MKKELIIVWVWTSWKNKLAIKLSDKYYDNKSLKINKIYNGYKYLVERF